MSYKPGFLKRIFRGVAAPLLLGGMILGSGAAIYESNVTTDMQVTVTGEHSALLRKGEGFGFTKTVYETDKGELTNTLNTLHGKFSRAGIEDQVKVGGTYDVKVAGFNLPWLGYYPNILSAKPVAPK